MKNFLRVLSIAIPYWPLVLGSLFCASLVALANIYPVYIMQDIIDRVLLQKNLATLNYIAVSLLVVIAIKGLASFAQSYSMSFIAEKVIYTLRERTMRQFQNLNISFFERNHSGNLISIIANDTLIIQQLMQTVVDLMVQMATFLGLIAFIFYLHWKMTLISLFIIPLVGLTVHGFSHKMKKHGLNIQNRIGELSAALGETFQGIMVIKSFNLEEQDLDRLGQVNKENFNASLKFKKLDSATVPVVEFINTIALSAILFYGGKEVIEGRLSAGQMMAFMTALVSLFTPIKRLTKINTMIAQSVGASERIFAILDDTDSMETLHEDEKIKSVEIAGKVEFEEVSFHYNGGEEVLHKVSLSCHPGEVVALVGSSGSGKSTITKLIPRFYSPSSGRILLDGIDIQKINLGSLRNHIGIVPQDVFLFNTSILENLRLGKTTATDQEIRKAAQAANALEFIEKLPDGFDSLLGERGCNLSGGQKQRLSIARALLKNPRILILDEATSALDSESESLVQEALDRLMKGRTTFVIAHRLSTIKNSNKIIVIQDGKVMEWGGHTELLNKGGHYKTLYDTQFNQRVVNG